MDVTRPEASTNLGAVEPVKEADGTSAPKETSASHKNSEDELDFLAEMMTTQFHHPHHRGAFHQVGSTHSFSKTVSLYFIFND